MIVGRLWDVLEGLLALPVIKSSGKQIQRFLWLLAPKPAVSLRQITKVYAYIATASCCQA